MDKTDTPRTDAAELDKAEFSEWGYGASGYCAADFARTLERDLAAANRRIEVLEGAAKALHALLNRNITYDGQDAVLRFETHDQAMNHIMDGRDIARAALSPKTEGK